MDNVRQKVIGFCDVDVKRALGVPPGRINRDRAWRLWYLISSNHGLIYNLESKSLHCFRIPGLHIVRRPVECDWVDRWLWTFNVNRREHMLEVTTASGEYLCWPDHTEPFYTELNVLLKGSGFVPCLSRLNSTF